LNYVERIIHLAKQGYTGVEFDEYDTDWNSEPRRRTRLVAKAIK